MTFDYSLGTTQTVHLPLRRRTPRCPSLAMYGVQSPTARSDRARLAARSNLRTPSNIVASAPALPYVQVPLPGPGTLFHLLASPPAHFVLFQVHPSTPLFAPSLFKFLKDWCVAEPTCNLDPDHRPSRCISRSGLIVRSSFVRSRISARLGIDEQKCKKSATVVLPHHAHIASQPIKIRLKRQKRQLVQASLAPQDRSQPPPL